MPKKAAPKEKCESCLSILMQLLDDPAVVQLLHDDARKGSKHPGWEDRNAEAARRRISEAKEKYGRLVAPESAHRISALKEFRNFHLGHSLFSRTKKEKLLYGYIAELELETAAIIPLLSVGLKGEGWDVEDLRESYGKEADALWKLARSGMLLKKRRKRRHPK